MEQVSIRNKTFYVACRDFVIQALNILKQEVSANLFPTSIGDLPISIVGWVFVMRRQDRLKSLPEYIELVNTIKSDGIISNYLGKMVGTPYMSVRVSDEDLAFYLLSHYITNTNSLDYNDENFMQAYYPIEDFFYTDTMRVKLQALLQNFSTEENINFDSNLTIRPLSDNEHKYFEGINRSFGFVGRSSLSFSNFLFEYVFSVKKFLESQQPIYNLHDYHEQDILQKLISTLRLFKAGKFGLMLTRLAPASLTPYMGERYSYSSQQFIGTQYILSTNEIGAVLKLWDYMKNLELKRLRFLKTGLDRFNFAYERNKHEDRLIDLMIALEALFFKEEGESERGEYRYRISLRTAVFLENEPTDRNTIFKTTREAYDLRSKIVHGSDVDLSKQLQIDGKQFHIHELVDTIEEYVRKSIKLFIIKLQEKKHEEIIDEIDDAILSKRPHKG